MDRDVQISWLEEFMDLTPEGLTCLERMISRIKQGPALFPYNPGDVYSPGNRQYSYKEILDGDYDDIDEKPITRPYIDLEVKTSPYCQQLLWYKGTTTMSSNNYVSILDCCVNTQPKQAMPARDLGVSTTCTPINPSWALPKAGHLTINKECTPMLTETEKKTNYLSSRLENILYTTSDNLVEKFNINEVKPKNTKQAKEWLAAGGLTVTGDDATRYFNVVWNDPAKPRDDAGYKAAYSALHTSYQNAIDTIRIAEPKDGLEALKAFETANLLPN